MSARALRAALAASIVAAAILSPTRADRLHLDSGGFIDADSWWIENDWLMYESSGGTIGIPRSSVIRIAPGDHVDPRPVEPSPPPRAGGSSGMAREELVRLMNDGVEAFKKRDYETASSRFYRVMQEKPDLHAARVGYATSEIALGHDGLALAVVLDGLVREPKHPELNDLLGDLRYREERTDDALRAWRLAFEVAPTDALRDKIFKGERDRQASAEYDFSASSHFNLRYDGEVDVALASAMMDYLEEQYWRLSDQLNHSPGQPITVVLYPAREFREVTQSPEWVGGMYDGKIRVPLGGLRTLTSKAKNVLVHELMHAMVHSKTRNNCPRWLHEGLAQHAEGKQLRGAEAARIRELLRSGAAPSAQTTGGFSYPMALSLTRYLESRQGIGGLVSVLDLLGQGKSIDDALGQVYGEDHAGLSNRWATETLEGSHR